MSAGNKIMISTRINSIERLRCKPKLIFQSIKQIDKFLKENTI